MTDPVPARVRDILGLFERELANARFADLDRETLEALADHVRDRAREVEEARAALEASIAALEESRSVLARRAEQALAYARVFAEEDADLAARVEAIEGEPAPKPIKRARKKNGQAQELPFAARA